MIHCISPSVSVEVNFSLPTSRSLWIGCHEVSVPIYRKQALVIHRSLYEFLTQRNTRRRRSSGAILRISAQLPSVLFRCCSPLNSLATLCDYFRRNHLCFFEVSGTKRRHGSYLGDSRGNIMSVMPSRPSASPRNTGSTIRVSDMFRASQPRCRQQHCSLSRWADSQTNCCRFIVYRQR